MTTAPLDSKRAEVEADVLALVRAAVDGVTVATASEALRTLRELPGTLDGFMSPDVLALKTTIIKAGEGAERVHAEDFVSGLPAPWKLTDLLATPEQPGAVDPLRTQARILAAWTQTEQHRLASRIRESIEAGADPAPLLAQLATLDAVPGCARLAFENIPGDIATLAIPPADFVLRDGMIPAGGVTLLAATGGAGKTYLSLEIAATVATGCTIIPGLETSKPGPVVIVTLEDDRAEILRRMQRIIKVAYLPTSSCEKLAANMHILCASSFEAVTRRMDGTLCAGKDLVGLKRELDSMKPRLLILDPLSALLGGVLDENDNGEARVFTNLVRAVIPPDCGCLMLCHVAKAEKFTAGSARGAGAWVDGPRQTLALRYPTASEKGKLPEGVRVIMLEQNKSNCSAERAPFYLERGPLGVLMRYVAPEAPDMTATLAPHILDLLSGCDLTRREACGKSKTDEGKAQGRAFRDALAARAGVSVSCETLDDVLGKMLSTGQIEQLPPVRCREVMKPAEKAEGRNEVGIENFIPPLASKGGTAEWGRNGESHSALPKVGMVEPLKGEGGHSALPPFKGYLPANSKPTAFSEDTPGDFDSLLGWV